MPSSNELRALGRNDLAGQISKKGGFPTWAARLGISRKHSDSDTGWDGEIALAESAAKNGFTVERMTGVKAPYDLVLDGVVRVDVKTARFAEYGPCRGWFYRVGKAIQADVLALYQLDTGACYFLPWSIGPTTNITISRSGGKYAAFKDRYDIIKKLAEQRKKETAFWP